MCEDSQHTSHPFTQLHQPHMGQEHSAYEARRFRMKAVGGHACKEHTHIFLTSIKHRTNTHTQKGSILGTQTQHKPNWVLVIQYPLERWSEGQGVPFRE